MLNIFFFLMPEKSPDLFQEECFVYTSKWQHIFSFKNVFIETKKLNITGKKEFITNYVGKKNCITKNDDVIFVKIADKWRHGTRLTSFLNLLCDDSKEGDRMFQFNVRIDVSDDVRDVFNLLNHNYKWRMFRAGVSNTRYARGSMWPTNINKIKILKSF